jgi:hypothetical protein
LRNTNCFVFGFVKPGIYGEPAILTPNRFEYPAGFVTGVKSGDHGAEFSALLPPW